MLKKSAALITCVMLVLTLLAGCSGDTNSASGTAAGSENIEINIVSSTMRLESMVDGWEQMIANFEAENPGVTEPGHAGLGGTAAVYCAGENGGRAN